MKAHQNPFRLSQTTNLPFQFEAGWSWERLLKELEIGHFRGAIVGPHGSGKTTLLKELVAQLRKLGYRVQHVRLSSEWRELPPVDRNAILVLDGAEQLRFGAWLKLRLLQRQLIISCHKPGKLKTVYQTTTSNELLRKLLLMLESDNTKSDELFFDKKGNIRKVFFTLYERLSERS